MSKKESNRINTRKLTYIGMLIGLSYVGSLIKIYDSIALDAIPAYFGALFLDPISGGIIAGIGHILTALSSGFPRTIPIHLVITLGMGLSAYLFGYLEKKSNVIIATIVAASISGIGMLAIAAPLSKYLGLPLNGMAMVYLLTVPLMVASVVNIVLGYILYKILKERI